MMHLRTIAILALACIATTLTPSCVAVAAENAPAAHYLMLTPDEIKWEPFPPLGPGVERAVLSGDPDKAGSTFVVRIKMLDGAKVLPHWHPVDEHVTVISGTFLYGVGDKFDEHALHELPQGSYAFMPKKTRHFAMSKGESITQASGVGRSRSFT
jgi:quercetin dioxygenase-like cupin family protein